VLRKETHAISPLPFTNCPRPRSIASAINAAAFLSIAARVRQSGKRCESEWLISTTRNCNESAPAPNKCLLPEKIYTVGYEVPVIRPRRGCLRADLATNAHCSLAVALLWLMDECCPSLWLPFLSYRASTSRFTRFHNMNDIQITNQTLD
jgi:hypothetical protein